MEDYASIDALNFSALKAHITGEKPPEDSEALRFGRAFEQYLQTGRIAEQVDEKAKELIENMAAKYMECAEVRELVRDCEWQKVFLGQYKSQKLKGRLDLYRPGLIVDLKTTRSLNTFEEAIKRYYYAEQLAFYRLLAGECEGVLVAVAKSPVQVGVYRLTQSEIETATATIYAWLDQYLVDKWLAE